MKRFITALCSILALSLLTACTAAIVTPRTTVPAHATPSLAPPPTNTPSPTVTNHPPTATTPAMPAPSPTPTPFAGLSSPGPYLLLKSYKDDSLLVYGTDRSAFTLPLPRGGIVRDLPTSVSPDGKWLVFFTGSPDDPRPDIHLNLLSLRDGGSREIAPLIAPGYPENMRPIAELINKSYPEDEEYRKSETLPLSADGWLQLLERDFPTDVMAAAWSPDSRSLAFAAQIDGPSADVYVYDLDSGKIRRMVDDMDNTFRVQWSPDGKYILYGNNIPGINYSTGTLSVIPANGGPYHNPKDILKRPWGWELGWIAKNMYVIAEQGDGGDPHDIRLLNTVTGQLKSIWPKSYMFSTYDPDHHVLFLCGEPDSKNQSENGDMVVASYFVQMDGSKRKVSDDCFYNLTYTGWKGAEFIGSKPNESFTVGLNGVITKFSDQDHGNFSVSPDRKWLVFYNDQTIDIFTEPGQPVRSVTSVNAKQVLWTPDSTGLWIEGPTSLFFLSMPDGDLESAQCLLDKCLGSDYSAIWVP